MKYEVQPPAKEKKEIAGVHFFVFMCVTYLSLLIPRFAFTINADQISDFYHIGPQKLSVLASIFFYPYALMQIPAGLLADFIPSEVLIAFSLFAAGLSNLFFILVSSFPLALACRLLSGLVSSLVYIPILRLLASDYPPEKFGLLSATLMTMNSICSIIVNGPFAIVSENYGWRVVFFISCAVTLPAAIIWFLLSGKKNKSEGTNKISFGMRVKELGESIQTIFINRLVWPMFTRGFITGGVMQSFQSLWAGPYMMIVLGMSRVEAGKVLVLMSLGAVIAGPIGGYLSDRVMKSRRGPSILSVSGSALCWITLFISYNFITPSLLKMILFTMSFMGGLGTGAQTAQVKEIHEQSLAGAAMGANNLFLTGGGAVLPAIFGLVLGQDVAAFHVNFRYVFLFGSSLMCAALIAAFCTRETFQSLATRQKVLNLP